MTLLPWSLEKLLGFVISSKQFYFLKVNLLVQNLDLLLHLSFHLDQPRPLGRRHGTTKPILPKRDETRLVYNVFFFCFFLWHHKKIQQCCARENSVKPKVCHDPVLMVSQMVFSFVPAVILISTNLTRFDSRVEFFFNWVIEVISQ